MERYDTNLSIEQLNHNLPVPLTLFIGRERELLEISQLLEGKHIRLLNIVGAGGIGKTRLAQEFIRKVASPHLHTSNFPDGLYFVPLAPLIDPTSIIATIAEHIGYPFQQDSQNLKQQLFDYLKTKRLLLFLDNFEHLVDAAVFVAEILQATSHVKVLTTSRSTLRLRGETVYTLKGLPTDSVRTMATALDNDAMQLFIHCAKRSNAAFTLRDDNLPHVLQVCRLVEGMPLAIELAAGWIRILSTREIAAEIQHNLNILRTRLRDVERRHQSIEAVFNQSWKLLSPEEQITFKQLTIFRSGFDREAARTVAGATFPVLVRLISHSLVRQEGEDRYGIHELLRQYGEAHLQEDNREQEAVLKRCTIFYAAFLHRQADHLRTMLDSIHLDLLQQEIGNIGRALNYLLAQERFEEISDSVLPLMVLYQQAGWLHEGRDVFSRIVEQLRHSEANQFRELALARSLIGLAWWQHTLGEHDLAVSTLDESKSLLQKDGDDSIDAELATLLRMRAAYEYGDVTDVHPILSSARQAFERLGWQYGLWLVNSFAAEIALQQGDLDLAKMGFQQLYSMSEKGEQVASQVVALAYLALTELERNTYSAARDYLRKAVNLCLHHRIAYPLPITLAVAALLFERHKLFEPAIHLAQIVLSLPASDFQAKRIVDAVHERLTKRGLNPQPLPQNSHAPSWYALDLIDRDELLSIDTLLDELAEYDSQRPDLTSREQEVLRLLVAGSTNQQIAFSLGIAEGTVKRYTHHLFTKLDAQNRAEAVYRAVDLGLI